MVKPDGVGANPSCCKKLRPMLDVTSDEVDIVPSTLLRTATGSPGTLALGTIGSVGSHAPSQLPPLPCGFLVCLARRHLSPYVVGTVTVDRRPDMPRISAVSLAEL